MTSNIKIDFLSRFNTGNMVSEALSCHRIEMMKIILQFGLAIAIFELAKAAPTLHDPAKDFTMPSDCGKAKRIVGGNTTERNAWPWQVALYEYGSFICGGSVMNQRYVICAAHCVTSYGETTEPKALQVLVGAHNRTTCEIKNLTCDGHWFNVSKIIYNKDYNDSTMQNDISLIRLETPIDFATLKRKVGPVCVADSVVHKENLVNKKALVTGWGTLSPGGFVSEVLQEAYVPIINHEQCLKAYDNDKESITTMNVCAGNTTHGGVDSCQGDSGGPLSIYRKNCWVQVGIVSWGYSCAVAEFPGVYTRVSSHHSWILRTLAKERKRMNVVEVQQSID